MDIDALKKNGELSKDAIMQIIPYNDYFLFLDKVTTLEKHKIKATKQITGKEDYLKGHFVDFPITPGALIVEGMGQAGTLLVRYNLKDHKKHDVLAYKIRDAKFHQPVLPGMEMTYNVKLKVMNERGAILDGKVFVKDQFVAEAFMMVAIVDKEKFRSKHQ